MIRNSFRFLASLTRMCCGMCCRMCCRVGYEGNSLKTSVILRTEHVKRKTVAWRMINYELPYSSNSVLFAFNNFPVQKIEQRRLAKKAITHVVTKRNSLVGTIANPLVGFMKIHFLGTVEKSLIRTVVKRIENGFMDVSRRTLLA